MFMEDTINYHIHRYLPTIHIKNFEVNRGLVSIKWIDFFIENMNMFVTIATVSKSKNVA
jgi:hypothetical protein